jgi:hypothetical protein
LAEAPARPGARWKADARWLVALGVALPLLAALLLGADASWDLRNYHLYNPHALLHGRWAIDLAPAQMQSWHNPLLDLPNYLLVRAAGSILWSKLWLVLPDIAALLLLFGLQYRLSVQPPSRCAQIVLALLVLGGAAFWSTLANTSGDAFVAAGILGSVVLAVSTDPREASRRWLLVGLLAGATAGLKLTALMYCVALAFAACCYGAWNARVRIARLLQLAAGGIAGLALTYGWWAWRLYRSTGNPLFPYANNLFGSPLAEALPYRDLRFVPHSVLDGLLAPVHLLARSQRFSEGGLKDPRLLLGLLAFAVLLYLGRRAGQELRARIALVAAFLFCGYLLWIFQFGIYRYALPLEMLGALGLVLLLDRLPRWRTAALVLAALLVNADTRRPDSGRVHSPAPGLGIASLALPDDSMVLVASDEPLGWVALALPDTTPMVSVGGNFMRARACTGLARRASQAIAAHAGPFWLLSTASATLPADSRFLAERYGVQANATGCKTVQSSLGSALLCPAAHVAPARLCAEAGK